MVKGQEAFPLRWETTQGCPLFSFLFNMILEGLAKQVGRKNVKDTQTGKEKTKMPLFVDDIIILYAEKSKDSTQKT